MLFRSLAHAAQTPGSLDGVWRSRGYDLLVAIRGDRATVYDDDAAECSVRSRDIALADALTRPRLTAGGAALVANDIGRSAIYTLDRVRKLPAPCTRPPLRSKDPRMVFESFFQAFKRNYAFFHERAIDWDGLGERYRRQITAHTADGRLFAILQIGRAHV